MRLTREALGDDAFVRVDANGGWSVTEAFAALSSSSTFRPRLRRTACRTVPELAELRTLLARAGIRMRIAADESVRKSENPLAVARAGSR